MIESLIKSMMCEIVVLTIFNIMITLLFFNMLVTFVNVLKQEVALGFVGKSLRTFAVVIGPREFLIQHKVSSNKPW